MASMARLSYGPQAQKQAKCLLEALLTYASDELDDCDRLKIQINWQSKNQLIVRTTVRQLEFLIDRVFKDYRVTSEQIKEALGRYQDFLHILEDHRTKTRGSDNWHFTLKLWFGRHEKAANLQRFDEEWERRRPEKSRQALEVNTEVQRRLEPLSKTSEIDKLVQLIREQVSESIQARCGYMRVLDMSKPVGLEAIYTTVNIYESIRGRQRHALADFLQQLDSTHPGQTQKAQLSALEAVERYSKLILFGKPGAGKTTFLKWLAIQCNRGHLWEDLIPVFISAKAFAEAKGQPELLNYIHKQWSDGEGERKKPGET
jgi:predicted NACHT family NTPase